MAGISFELKKLLKQKSLIALLTATGYSAILSTGNWVLAVGIIIVFSLISQVFISDPNVIINFQVYITYTIAISLILSGPLQLMFTRYVADRLFEKEPERIVPNFNGAIIICMGYSFIIALILSFYLFNKLDYIYHILFSFTISVQSGLWTANSLLAGLKRYKHVIISFLTSYLFIGVGTVIVARFGLPYILAIFYIGQSILLFSLMWEIVGYYPSNNLLDWDFLKSNRSYYILALVGFFYNFGIWIDKIIFWISPYTGSTVLGNIRASVIYDVPVLLSYLCLIPGIAIFFLKTEAEFAVDYDNYYDAVRWWGRLSDIYKMGNRMILEVQSVFYDTLIIQGIFLILILFAERFLFKLARVPELYIPLFNVLLIGAILQLGFMVIFAILSYFDRKKELMIITTIFGLLNLCLTIVTQKLGPFYFGYGYVMSLLVSDLIGMILLRSFLDEIHYKIFMLNS